MEEKKTGAAAALALLNQKFPVADVIAGTKCERAIKWELTIGDDLTPKWTHSIVCVSIEKTPFAKGSCRTAHKLKDWSHPDQGLVGKFSTNKKTTRDSYFTDVLMQTFCAKWAEKFNEAKPPKPITFLPSYVYELIDHPPPYPVCGGEPFIEGDYKKHNNNSGYVSSDARNTPQSFSHFSYELSNHELLIVDIQGVNDFYTDPQIHTKNGEGFGEGNLGETGFHKFLQTHKCNPVCDFLKLKPINQSKKALLRGTLPVVQLMDFHDAIGLNGNNGSPQKNYDMNYFRNGGGAQQPISLDDEEKMLQEQLERIRAQQQKNKPAPPLVKQPSGNNLNKQSAAAAAGQPISPKPAIVKTPSQGNVNKPISPSKETTTTAVVAAATPGGSNVKVESSAPQPQPAHPAPAAVSVQVRNSPPPSQPISSGSSSSTTSSTSSVQSGSSPDEQVVPDRSAFEKWDLKTIRNHDTIRGLQSECITGDSSKLFSGSNDGQIGIWDCSGEIKHITNIKAHGKSVRSIIKRPNFESNILTAGADSYVKEWDINTQTVVKEIKESNEVNTIFIQDNLLYTGCNDKTVKVWDMRNYECVKTLSGHTRAIKSVCALGNLLFSGSNDQQIYVWNLQTGTILTNFQGHEGWVKTLYTHNNMLYSGSHDETIRVWDLKTTRCVNTIKCKDRVETLHVTNQGIFAGSGDYLQVFNHEKYENLASVNTRSSILCLWRNQNQLFTGSLASNLKVWTWDNM
ncbi:myosin heavy chain kinase C [Dictyostelium purpureum]|uniref:Myosin heavy chain kinase C n=1 Tax=Dictyostelium purpureum TaxID=5786 RepID=F1A471_DICPU|nr:myosin heavy chain kinase C [Dictyostelium purpureum]EGC29009.1 myosin heavy chain kinase C [Dictyostelium purpureum]|eukprot:XP_003294466.1 myosin heavy chain kinase C [Dictyostelium purpureum]